MSAPSRDQYNSLKSQYDQLLQKHQNDSIRIKQKEHALNEQINKIKNQSLLKEQELNATISKLHEKIEELNRSKGKQRELNVQVSPQKNTRIQELERDLRKLIDQNIMLTSQNTSLKVENNTLQGKNNEQTLEIEKLRDYIQSLQKDLPTAEQFKSLQEKYQKSVKNAQNLKQNFKQLKEKLKLSQQEYEKISERERKAINLLKKKDVEISALQSQLNALKVGQKKRKTTQISQNTCPKCAQLHQEIHLLKQMVKSTQVMVRVKQIQNQKFRMHSQEVISNQSRSSAKQKEKEKGTPLPPLRKK